MCERQKLCLSVDSVVLVALDCRVAIGLSPRLALHTRERTRTGNNLRSPNRRSTSSANS